jgi:peptidoglycan hydrolase-like protein with peptidoglycan-binding domain
VGIGVRVGALVVMLAAVLAAGTGGVHAQSAAETAFWNRVRNSSDASAIRAYLEAYPNGFYAEAARTRLKVLEPSGPGPRRTTPSGSALNDATIVREVQERLYNLNYDISVFNGQMNEETRAAIRNWQRIVKHDVTGDMSREELDLLRSARIPTTWGAVAYAAKGAGSVVWSRPSRREAATAALNDCHQRAGRDPCKVLTAAEKECGALGFYTGNVRRTTYWGAYPAIRPTLGQAIDQALTYCRENAKRPEACGIRLSFCADGSHLR